MDEHYFHLSAEERAVIMIELSKVGLRQGSRGKNGSQMGS